MGLTKLMIEDNGNYGLGHVAAKWLASETDDDNL